MAKLRLQLKSEEAKAAGAWTKQETWTGMRRNLTGFKVRKLLGNPTKIKNSLNPRVDQVYHYEGDLNADGTNEVGQVSFSGPRGFLLFTVLSLISKCIRVPSRPEFWSNNFFQRAVTG